MYRRTGLIVISVGPERWTSSQRIAGSIPGAAISYVGIGHDFYFFFNFPFAFDSSKVVVSNWTMYGHLVLNQLTRKSVSSLTDHSEKKWTNPNKQSINNPFIILWCFADLISGPVCRFVHSGDSEGFELDKLSVIVWKPPTMFIW